MEKAGLNPADPDDRARFALQTINEFQLEMTRFIRRLNADAYTHWELESLPSGGWGYLDFPLKVRYTRTLGLDSMGMTGKFHTSWGDFHSYKNQPALQFECFQMLALGAKCSVGDQLHPVGKMDQAAYDLIGSVYAEVEKKEPWCAGARPVVEIGVLTPEEFLGGSSRNIPAAAHGVTRMFQELAYQFDILDSQSDFSGYKLLVLPDEIPVGGGALLASFESGLKPDKSDFALRSLGVRLKGDAPYSPDFIVPKGDIGKGLPPVEQGAGAGDRPLLQPHLGAFLLPPPYAVLGQLRLPGRGAPRAGHLFHAPRFHPVPQERAALGQTARRQRHRHAAAGAARARPGALDHPDRAESPAGREPLGAPPAALHPRAPGPGLRRDRGRDPDSSWRRKATAFRFKRGMAGSSSPCRRWKATRW